MGLGFFPIHNLYIWRFTVYKINTIKFKHIKKNILLLVKINNQKSVYSFKGLKVPALWNLNTGDQWDSWPLCLHIYNLYTNVVSMHCARLHCCRQRSPAWPWPEPRRRQHQTPDEETTAGRRWNQRQRCCDVLFSLWRWIICKKHTWKTLNVPLITSDLDRRGLICSI